MPGWKYIVAAVVLAGAGLHCESPAPPPDYVARVDDAYLTQADLDAALATLANPQDTAEARRQIVEQWITNELLYQEALRRNLRDADEVKQRLEESERAVLIDALVSTLYADEQDEATPAEIRSYYERHKEQLRLREPFVRLHHLATPRPDSAERARALLQEAIERTDADSLWPHLAHRFADAPEDAIALAGTYLPENRLFMNQPPLRTALGQLGVGQLASVIEADSAYHVLRVADRVPAGTEPELAWVEDEVRRLLAIETRKQMFHRQVERLRTEAQARDALVVR